MRKGLFYILLLFVLLACSSDDGCMQNLKFSMKADIYRMIFDTSIEQFVPEKYSASITLHGLNNDSLLYNSQTTSILEFPLQKLDTISSFVLMTSVMQDTSIVTIIDTIDFYHHNIEEFISLECGCIVTNTLVGVSQTTNNIDSIVVVSPEVNLQSKNNIKIYLSQR